MNVYLGEFIGTATLMLLGDGVVAAVLLPQSKAKDGGWMVITVAWGLAVLFGIYACAPSGSGAHMNPALTIGLAALGKFSWSFGARLCACANRGRGSWLDDCVFCLFAALEAVRRSGNQARDTSL